MIRNKGTNVSRIACDGEGYLDFIGPFCTDVFCFSAL